MLYDIIPPGIITKPHVFWWFQRDLKLICLNSLNTKSEIRWHSLSILKCLITILLQNYFSDLSSPYGQFRINDEGPAPCTIRVISQHTFSISPVCPDSNLYWFKVFLWQKTWNNSKHKNADWLTHSFTMHPFSAPWKHQKISQFSDVFRGQTKGALGTHRLRIYKFICTYTLLDWSRTSNSIAKKYVQQRIKKLP